MAIDRQRLHAELRTIRALIEKDAAVKARFDSDGNGVIDGHEWEQVRRLVIARLEREDAEREAAAASGAGRDAPVAAPGAVAQEIYESDLPAVGAAAARSIGEADEFVLEQQGGFGAKLEGTLHRRYAVYAPDGEPLASIEQLESEILQGQVPRSPFEIPDLGFRILEAATRESWNIRRCPTVGSEQLEVHDASGSLRAVVAWKLSLLRRSYRVEPVGAGDAISVQGQLLHPLTLSVRVRGDDEIGEIERGWSGLGVFLGRANRIRIRIRTGGLVPGHRYGLVAASLLEDLAAGA